MCLILTSSAQLEKAIEIVEQWNTDTGMIVKIKPLDQTAPLSRGIKEQTKTAIAIPKKLNKTFKITQKKRGKNSPPVTEEIPSMHSTKRDGSYKHIGNIISPNRADRLDSHHWLICLSLCWRVLVVLEAAVAVGHRSCINVKRCRVRPRYIYIYCLGYLALHLLRPPLHRTMVFYYQGPQVGSARLGPR